MPININTSNYINTQTTGSGNSQSVVSSANASLTEGVTVSVKGIDLQPGATLSGQIVEIDGKDIKLLLSNNQTINARLEGNISTLLGQTLSFEVKSSENGQTALRPLYTNLNSSQTVSNALQNAGLPVTENYVKMVSSMMDENMPINKQAIYDMSKQVNTFPAANPDTLVKLNKLGLQVNELTINQYENYKGFEHQISKDVETISKGLTDMMKESLADLTKELSPETVANENIKQNSKPESRNLLSAFLNAISGNENRTDASISVQNSGANETELVKAETNDSLEIQAAENELTGESLAPTQKNIDPGSFDTTKMILDLIDTESESNENSSTTNASNTGGNTEIPTNLKALSDEILELMNTKDNTDVPAKNIGKDSILRDLVEDTPAKKVNSANDLLNMAKTVLNQLKNSPESVSEELKGKLVKLISDKGFSNIVKDSISKQMLLKPEEVVNSKNINELYTRITRQTNQIVEMLQNSGKDNPELMNAAKNINDNVSFMNELNQVVTYVQLPLLMNNKSAHGDLYVYTNKKSLKNNDGSVSALLHLDMENLGPMDVYVQLTNSTKLNTHFYLKDEETIDFIEAHIDYLNKRLADKGYDMSMNISVKDMAKGPTNMSKEFMKDDPGQEGMSVSKFSFDVRA